MQTEPPCQRLKSISHYLLRLIAKLPVEVAVVVCIHAALGYFGGVGSIKEACRDP
jgi:hypothetical protein